MEREEAELACIEVEIGLLAAGENADELGIRRRNVRAVQFLYEQNRMLEAFSINGRLQSPSAMLTALKHYLEREEEALTTAARLAATEAEIKKERLAQLCTRRAELLAILARRSKEEVGR